KAGGAYLPMDPAYPDEWLRYTAGDAGARVVVTQRALERRFEGAVRGVCLDGAEALSRQPAQAPESGVGAENLAYVIYTSGSTGRPKGVGITHRSLGNLVTWHQQAYEVMPDDRASLVMGMAFDASVWELWSNITAGASVHIPEEEVRVSPKALLRWLAEDRISMSCMPTAMAEAALEEAWPEEMALRVLFTGGDALHRRPARGQKARMVNLYGPTENTVVSTGAAVESEGVEGVLPHIGRPIANVRAYLLDERLEPVPVGVWGELYLGGENLARGYLGRAGLTAERFLPNPFSEEPGARMYRTGDVVRLLSDGNLEFRGRRDAQVKVRGYRIELGEVEAALVSHPAVKEGVVVAREDVPGSKRLVAYYVGGEQAPEVSALRAYLGEKLPEHMVPSAFMRLEALPLTPNGKVDRKVLPAPEVTESEAYVAPRTAVEEVVAGIWASLLGLPRVGVHDNFFELGGHSLLATRVASRLQEVLRVELPVRVLFEAPMVAQLAERLEAQLGGRQGTLALVPVPREGAIPLSFAQQRLWFLSQLAPGGFSYNVPFFARLKGRLEVAALERSLREIVQRHEALRTTFVTVDGQPVQRIASELDLSLPVEGLESVPEEVRERALRQRAEEEARYPFVLEEGPLVRARLLRVKADEHVLLLTLHHIVCDGWSMGVLVRELNALYTALSRGEEPRLPAIPVQYADFTQWQREWLQGEVLEAQLSWWKHQLAGAPLVLELPTDRPRPLVQTFRGAFLPVRLPLRLSGPLRALCRQEGVTPFMLLLAAYHVLLSRYSGQTDLVVGSPIAGRNRHEVEELIGFFVNTLALRVDASGETSFREMLRRVREACLGAYAHQELPFDKLVDALQPERDLARSPLFQVMFALQDAPPALELPGVLQEALEIDPGMAKFDLTLFVRETADGLMSFWEYNTDLFDEATVARMAAHYVRLLEGAVENPERQVSTLPLLTEEERRQVLVAWNATATEYPRESCIQALFEEQVERAPEAVAVEEEGARLSYGELNRRANQVARHLRRLGVVEGTRVGLCAGRSLEMVVGTLGILKAGGTYVPLDPEYPRERLAFMAEDTGVPVVLVQPHLEERLPALDAKVVRLSWESFERESGENPGERVSPEAMAYVMYTSGSTGRPKGVCIPHRGVVRLVRDTNYIRLTEEDRVGQMSNTAFDAATFELWGALLNGGRLVMIPREVSLSPRALAAYLRGKQVSALFVTTALFNQVAAECPEAFRTLGCVLTGGDALDARWVRRVLEKGAPKRLLNAYGPTESTTFATWHELKELSEGATTAPIGRPLANTWAYALDERMEPVPVGVVGELYLGGDGLALGYLNQPELTRERFVPNPFSGEEEKLYRTGDLVRYLPDGSLEFLGRRDAQVKVRGFRIELGEVEAALARYPGVGEVVVTAREDGPGGKRLVAYVVPREGEGVEGTALRAFLKERLPEYMVPAGFVRLEALPLTPNGKVDRKALPAPELEAEGTVHVAPRTAMEEVVASIWGPLLGLSCVGVHDDFFELGGHSLLAAQVASRLREVLQMELPVRTLFEASTVEALAERLESLRGVTRGPRPPPLVPVPRDEALPLSFSQQRMWFLEQFEPGGFSYNVPMATRLRGPLDVAALERSLGALVPRHEVLRTT
ncbi:MAG TPA: amino acid adenylation domain-containing protein, partial [Myxococcaceae bacterium]|nr:amino acid adenylation domain-containing protein [Myxococcaceae bacterium]